MKDDGSSQEFPIIMTMMIIWIYPVDKEKSSRSCLLLDVDQFLSIVVWAHLHDKFLEYFSQHDENGLSPYYVKKNGPLYKNYSIECDEP